MFCGQCGTENLEVARYCENCGSALGSSAGDPVGGYTPVTMGSSSNKGGLIAAIAAAAVVVVAGVVIVGSLVFGGGPEGVVKNMVKAMNNPSEEAILKVYPKEMQKIIKEEADETLEYAVESLEEALEYAEDEYGKGKFECKILDKEKMDKSDVEDAEENYIESMEWLYDYDSEADFTAGYELDVKLIYNGEDEEESDRDTVRVYKVDGKWCILDF